MGIQAERSDRSGVLRTASDLVFSGGRDGYFFALNGRNGELLWKATLGGQVSSGPMSYSVNGKHLDIQDHGGRSQNLLHLFTVTEYEHLFSDTMLLELLHKITKTFGNATSSALFVFCFFRRQRRQPAHLRASTNQCHHRPPRTKDARSDITGI